MAERKKVVKSRNGTLSYAWEAHSHENHLRDCMVYSTAAAGHAKLLDLRPAKGIPLQVDMMGSVPLADAEQHAPPPPVIRQESALSRMLKARAAGSGSIGMRKL